MLYVAIALGAGGVGLLWLATIAEGVLGTMATVALFALMMDASDPEHAGTDYTLLACVVLVVGMIANFCRRGDRGRVRLCDRVHDGRGAGAARLPRADLGAGPQSDLARALRAAWRTGSTQPAATPSRTSATEY